MCGGHGDTLPLLCRRSQIAGKVGIVGIDGGLHSEVSNLCLDSGLVIQSYFFKVSDIREDSVVVRLV
jgi:hypothetical protein